ncbi:MAG: M20/M25/M40 family metallo-hydrolase [Hyphomicrobiales bacterium]|nr:M20/M25/M40 family metallo-hydrolase [Hyphomicrobiales bacterium]
MSQLDAVLTHIDNQLPQSLDRLFELLRIKSISTDPTFKDDCHQAAQWLVNDLESIGFEASLRDTDGHPMVVGHQQGPENSSHLLFYGHYDVQPVDPLNLWKLPPFEPVITELKEGRKQIHGRGAADDKGQLMTFVEACRCWKHETGSLPCSLTILFEGEEESGSPSLLPFFKANAEELTCDLALVCDTGMWDIETPAISTALRGIVTEDFIIKAANRDLHSGHYGGAAVNPIHILTKILAGLHDESGRVTLEGFYDDVEELPEELRKQWDDLGFDAGKFLSDIGLTMPAGEANRSVLEQIWSRPTAEVNGIQGGYSGDGFKTVIAAQASAKVSFRLVSNMDPEKVHTSFKSFLESQLPEDCTVEYLGYSGAGAITLDHTLPQIKAAADVLTEEWGNPAAIAAMGGSVPIVGEFKRLLGMDSLMVGFGLEDDAIHSPNEKYELSSFHKGTRSWARILDALAEKK